MAYSESLARRVRHVLVPYRGITEKKMFGALGFLMNGNLCVGVWKSSLIVRLGPEQAKAALEEPHVVEFDVTGRSIRGGTAVQIGKFVSVPVRLFGLLWASPYTLLGLLIGLIGICTGGHGRIRSPVIEFYGGGVKWLLHRFPHGQFTLAFTLGHTVLGQTDAALDVCRDHELVHVRQFERWGPLMGPAYLGCSLVLWLMGRRPYLDNPFERQAYAQGGGE